MVGQVMVGDVERNFSIDFVNHLMGMETSQKHSSVESRSALGVQFGRLYQVTAVAGNEIVFHEVLQVAVNPLKKADKLLRVVLFGQGNAVKKSFQASDGGEIMNRVDFLPQIKRILAPVLHDVLQIWLDDLVVDEGVVEVSEEVAIYVAQSGHIVRNRRNSQARTVRLGASPFGVERSVVDAKLRLSKASCGQISRKGGQPAQMVVGPNIALHQKADACIVEAVVAQVVNQRPDGQGGITSPAVVIVRAYL